MDLAAADDGSRGNLLRSKSLDVRERMKNPSKETARLKELYRSEIALFRKRQGLLDELAEELAKARDDTERNVRRMRAAVAMSQQPGTIDYKQKLQDRKDTEKYKSLVRSLEEVDFEMTEFRTQILELRQADLKISSQSQKGLVNSVQQWLQNHGEPKLEATPHQRFRSVCRTKGHRPIAGALSKDGTVKFTAERSAVRPMIRGKLID
uniref:Uncharacterized protein n=1 Tax=Chromera velia CCMP2878 TaxID=1169474 RepID=A0A0G4G8E5_9ALVE|eukprot:Cvel_4338.t1-p1 / transcript=Cvel_4338.t1 / gene=Cvel_4338 / organism=Chromera_velia_CCMP2878 / gene_product=hypothetical protein / transcript_product=hypothetical protein / location=Cvel_scaffold188:32434-35603(-) / protein_length=207 / sequence_SO=supercontig / SO=protein_coding / is_pseudo=false